MLAPVASQAAKLLLALLELPQQPPGLDLVLPVLPVVQLAVQPTQSVEQRVQSVAVLAMLPMAPLMRLAAQSVALQVPYPALPEQ